MRVYPQQHPASSETRQAQSFASAHRSSRCSRPSAPQASSTPGNRRAQVATDAAAPNFLNSPTIPLTFVFMFIICPFLQVLVFSATGSASAPALRVRSAKHPIDDRCGAAHAGLGRYRAHRTVLPARTAFHAPFVMRNHRPHPPGLSATSTAVPFAFRQLEDSVRAHVNATSAARATRSVKRQGDSRGVVE